MADTSLNIWHRLQHAAQELKTKRHSLEKLRTQATTQEEQVEMAKSLLNTVESELASIKERHRGVQEGIDRLTATTEQLLTEARSEIYDIKAKKSTQPKDEPGENATEPESLPQPAADQDSPDVGVAVGVSAHKERPMPSDTAAGGRFRNWCNFARPLNDHYSTVVNIDDEWLSIACRHCGSNALSCLSNKFITGCHGMSVHMKVHGFICRMDTILDHCTTRIVSDRDIKLMSSNPPQPPQDVPITLNYGTIGNRRSNGVRKTKRPPSEGPYSSDRQESEAEMSNDGSSPPRKRKRGGKRRFERFDFDEDDEEEVSVEIKSECGSP